LWNARASGRGDLALAVRKQEFSMSKSTKVQCFGYSLIGALALTLLALGPMRAIAGHFVFANNQVGGVKIDADGVVGQPDRDGGRMWLAQLRKDVKTPAKELAMPVGMRTVSLKGLEAALADAMKNNLGHVPDEVRFLAGLQRIEYVFVYPEEGDIVLAGPGEGWKIRDDATVVGLTTDRPVIQLDDLVVAFRTAKDAAKTVISCSIDPTEKGRKQFEAVLARHRTFNPAVIGQLQEAMGPQTISLTGVPATSHLARVLVAADYRMKRIAMHLEPSPLRSLPSFLTMLDEKKASGNNMMPRWWLACNYEPLGKSDDGLAWQLRGPGVKCMTEEDFVSETGEVKGTGKKNPVAQAWADQMTKVYDELSTKDSVFGDLRNVMDLCVVAALIEKEGLLSKVKLELPTLLGKDSELTPIAWHAPKSVATQASFLKSGRNYIITASGGVEVTSWEVASRSENSAKVAALREKTKVPAGAWWAN
jgi:hypothetical protein